VNLDAATGKLRWYYQGVTNDFMDHDMQTSPIAATINGQPAIIGSGKMGGGRWRHGPVLPAHGDQRPGRV
jgi:glucose dehydrogenase